MTTIGTIETIFYPDNEPGYMRVTFRVSSDAKLVAGDYKIEPTDKEEFPDATVEVDR